MAGVNARLRPLGIPPLEIGIGINTGEVIVGNIGSAKRAKYGVVGSNVNLAARIEAATVGGQVLVSKSTVDALPGLLEIRRDMTLRPKGARDAIPIFEIGAILGVQPLRLPLMEEKWVTLAEPMLLECAMVSDEKQIVGAPFAAHIIARCVTSVRLDTRHGLELAVNLRMRPVSRAGSGLDADLYGKVVSRGPAADHFVVRFTSALAESSPLRQTDPSNSPLEAESRSPC
jgi:adenylate cyclase